MKKMNTYTDAKNNIRLVDDGVTEYVIVRGKYASPAEITASEELQKYLWKISGVELPIVSDSTPAMEKEIIIGRTNREGDGDFNREKLGEDGFVIKTTDEKLWLVGGQNRGTLYSVYTFLEEYLGCRFFTKEVEQIPNTTTIVVDKILEDKQIPAFMFRDAGFYDYRYADFAVKRKINFNTWYRNLAEKWGGGISYAKGNGGHSFAAFINPRIYFATHPEYFSMNEQGERVSNRQLCLTNPEVLELVKKGVRQWLAEDSTAKIITISQNDIQGPCLCENCRKVYEEEGGAYSGTLIRFVNAIAEDIAADYPDVWVDTYAYQYSRSAPTKTKPADNVMIRLCPIECDFSKPHGEDPVASKNPSYLNGDSKTYAEDFEAWGKICKHVFMYDYHANFQNWALTFPDFHNIRKNFEYYAKKHAMGVMAEGPSSCLSPEMGALRGYLVSKVLWNPLMDEAEFEGHIDDFLTGVYGPGGKFIREYIELAEELTKDVCIGLVTEADVMYPSLKIKNHGENELPEDLSAEMIRNYQTAEWSKYQGWYTTVQENPIISKGEELFQSAMAMAENDSQKRQLDRIYTQVEYIKSYHYKQKLDAEKAELEQLLKNYMELYSNEFSEDEKADLPSTIAEYACEKERAEYIQYNKKLCDTFLSRGIPNLYSGLSIIEFLPKFDFSQAPADWFERTWLNA